MSGQKQNVVWLSPHLVIGILINFPFCQPWMVTKLHSYSTSLFLHRIHHKIPSTLKKGQRLKGNNKWWFFRNHSGMNWQKSWSLWSAARVQWSSWSHLLKTASQMMSTTIIREHCLGFLDKYEDLFFCTQQFSFPINYRFILVYFVLFNHNKTLIFSKTFSCEEKSIHWVWNYKTYLTMNKNIKLYGCFKHNTVSSPELLPPQNQRELKYASLCCTKKQIFYTNSTEVELIPGCKQPNRWIRVYDMHMQYIFILFCNLSAKCVYCSQDRYNSAL